jgi:hypothetical protein
MIQYLSPFSSPQPAMLTRWSCIGGSLPQLSAWVVGSVLVPNKQPLGTWSYIFQVAAGVYFVSCLWREELSIFYWRKKMIVSEVERGSFQLTCCWGQGCLRCRNEATWNQFHMPWDLSHKFLPSAKSVHTTIGASSELYSNDLKHLGLWKLLRKTYV